LFDKVALKCGAQLAADVWQIDVVIGSPTTSTDIGGFAPLAPHPALDPTILQ